MNLFELERLNEQRLAGLARHQGQRHEGGEARRQRDDFLGRVTHLAQLLMLVRVG